MKYIIVVERFDCNHGWYGVAVIGNIHDNPELMQQPATAAKGAKE